MKSVRISRAVLWRGLVGLAMLASQWGKRAARWVLLLVPVALRVGIVVGNRFTSCSLVYGLNFVMLVALGGLLIAPTRTALSVVAAAPAYRPFLSMY